MDQAAIDRFFVQTPMLASLCTQNGWPDSESLKVMGTIASSNLFSPSEPRIPSSEYPRSNGEERQGQRDPHHHPRELRLVPCPGFSYAPRRAGSMDREHLVGRAGAIAPCGKSDLHRDEGPAHGYRPAVRVGLVARRRGDQERVRAVHLEEINLRPSRLVRTPSELDGPFRPR